jgi:hypothetical protein
VKICIGLPVLWLTAACASGGGGGGGSGTGSAARPTIDPVAPPPIVNNLRLQPDAMAHYALTRLDSLTIEMAGAEQGQVLDRTLYLTITSESSSLGRQITILVDSLQTREAGLVSPLALDSLRGMRWTGILSPEGRMGRLTANRATLLGAPLDGQFRLLFPVLPPGGARSGATWSDSTSDTVQVSAFGGRDQARLQYSTGEAERAMGQPVLPVKLQRLSTITGLATQSGQTISLSGTDSTEATYRISSPGRLLAVDGSSNSTLTISIPSVGQTLPATQRAVFSLTRLP